MNLSDKKVRLLQNKAKNLTPPNPKLTTLKEIWQPVFYPIQSFLSSQDKIVEHWTLVLFITIFKLTSVEIFFIFVVKCDKMYSSRRLSKMLHLNTSWKQSVLYTNTCMKMLVLRSLTLPASVY